MKFTVKVDGFADLAKEFIDEADRAGAATMDDVTVGMKTDYREQTEAAGLGSRLSKTWQGRRYPQGRPSMDAAAFVWSKAPKIIGAFTATTLIRSKDGFYLAIPTAAAGARGIGASGKSARITPGGWERRTGMRLRFVYRAHGPSLLVADNAALSKKGLARSALRRKEGAEYVRVQGRVTVVIFILVPQVTLRKRLDIDSVANKWADKVPELLAQHWK